MSKLKFAIVFSIIFFGVLFFAKVSWAATYYVATSGNDFNSGTESSPWRTIQKAANTINGGDTAIVKDGTYSSFTVSRSGTDATHMITIQAANKWGAVVSQANTTVLISGSWVKIDGFKFTGYGVANGKSVSITGSHDIVTNCYLDQVWTFALFLDGATYSTVSNNYLYWISFGILQGGNNNLVENNEIYGAKSWHIGEGDGDYMRIVGSNQTVRGNKFWGVDYNQLNPSVHFDSIQVFDAIGYPESPVINLLIENNYFDGGDIILDSEFLHQSNNVIIRNNIIRCIGCGWGIVNKGITNLYIYNNTIDVTNGTYPIGSQGDSGLGGSIHVWNNILYAGNNTAPYWASGTAQILSSGTNLAYRPGYTYGVYPGDTTDIKNVDPLFVNRTTGNYSLQSGSPAINIGTTLTGFSTDKNGVTRPQGSAWDIGAYEYASGGGDSTPPALSNGSPSGSLAAGITQTTMSVTTNESATCRWSSTAGTAYSSMTNTFSTTGGTTHSTTITGLANGQTYNRYIRCQDTAGNPNTSDYTITFSVASPIVSSVIDFTAVNQFDSLTTAQIQAAAAKRIMFRHASVGANINDGLNSLATQNSIYNRNNFTFQNRGNPGWQAKIQDIISQAAIQSSNFDALSMKFCYIDYAANSTSYINAMESLETNYPTKTFVWWTMPTTTSGNIAAIQTFNNNVRAYVTSHNKVLFDLASIESHHADGSACQSGGVENLCSEYTTDGGHLILAASQRVAKAFWVLMSRLAGSVIPNSYTLNVLKSGTGSGTVTSNPSGINCGSTCSQTVNSGTNLTLTASANSGSAFAGWSGGGCSGTGTCAVTVSSNIIVTATFSLTTDTQSPTIPTNLSTAVISSSQINLSWSASTDNVGVTGYRIYRAGTQIGTSVSNSYSDTGLTANTTYVYRVAAYDAAGNVSFQSSLASATTQSASVSGNIEAESGTLTSPMQIVLDSVASGNAYIQTTTGESGTAVYSFNIATAGTYKIVARVYAQNGGTDSFYVKVDNLIEDTWDLNPSDTATDFNVWREDEVTKRGTGTFDAPQYDPYTLNLTSGNHTITFRGRETSARLDYFRLVNVGASDTIPPSAPTGVVVN